MQSFKNKRILVIGACGTIGQELLAQLLQEYEEIKTEIEQLRKETGQ